MADGDNIECSKSHNSNIMSRFLDGNTISDLRVEEVKEALSPIHNWATINWMNLNIKKCKEIRICFSRQQPPLPSLSNDNHHLDIVTSYKVLGLTLQNDLKWGSHIDDMVRKASKRLHIIRVIGRAVASNPKNSYSYIYISY